MGELNVCEFDSVSLMHVMKIRRSSPPALQLSRRRVAPPSPSLGSRGAGTGCPSAALDRLCRIPLPEGTGCPTFAHEAAPSQAATR